MKRTRFLLGILLLILSLNGIAQQRLVITASTPLYTDAITGQPLYKAVLALQRDILKITGHKLSIKQAGSLDLPGIIIVNSQTNASFKTIKGWEAHRVYDTILTKMPFIVLEGADMRGAIYAVYTFSEKVLGVPPLWFYCGWEPDRKSKINIPATLDIREPSPVVKYRAWFPNDMDLFSPWRKLSAENNELWLETALRLKINTIEWHDEGERDMALKYSVSPTTRLIHDYGLINTTHHHSPLNASFANWEKYWQKVKGMSAPELSLANESYIEEYWRYNIETIKRAKLDMIWVIGFRGQGDHPFWYTFKDAPASSKERGEVISRMMKKQRDLVIEIMEDSTLQFRTIFYDELSDLLAEGFIHPPADDNLIWNFVAARRDHFPNHDIQRMPANGNICLGYYFNYQFTSTGSHLAAGEGPWKMEQNYRFVAGKSKRPILFSVVNAGNLREFVMELSANASMMWSMNTYNSDKFLKTYAGQYFGEKNATAVAALYKDYYKAYWQQRKPDLPGIDRQFVFQDLRYKRAINEIVQSILKKKAQDNPLTDVETEQLPGRTYRIIPADNQSLTMLESVEKGTAVSSMMFATVMKKHDKVASTLKGYRKQFLYDNLGMPASLMYHLNEALNTAAKAFRDTDQRDILLGKTVLSLKAASDRMNATQYGAFKEWYAKDKIFNIRQLISVTDSAAGINDNLQKTGK